MGNCCQTLCERQSLAQAGFAPMRYQLLQMDCESRTAHWCLSCDRLLVCLISLLDGRKTIFFSFFFFGNKIPRTNKMRRKKRQRIQFCFPKDTWGHTASSFSSSSGNQRWFASRLLPAALICLLQQPPHQLLQILPGLQLFLQTLLHPFVLLQSGKIKEEWGG